MSHAIDPLALGAAGPVAASGEVAPSLVATSASGASERGLVSGVVIILAISLASGAIAAATVVLIHPVFRVPLRLQLARDAVTLKSFRTYEDDAIIAEYVSKSLLVQSLNSSIVLALTGMIVAGALASIESARRRAAGGLTLWLVCGATFGGALGLIGGLTAEFVALQIAGSRFEDLGGSVATNAIGWSLTGLAVGLAMGLPSLNWPTIRQTSAGALLGGVLASLLFNPGQAAFFPSQATSYLIPFEPGAIFCWVLLATTLSGVLGALVARPRPGRSVDEGASTTA